MTTVTIPLTGKYAVELGLEAVIDEADLNLAARRTWNAGKFKSTGAFYFYAWARIDGKKVLLHRLIAGAKRGELVDH